jgi:hypothetical protein
MKAIIKALSKEVLPRFHADTNRDEPTIMLVAQVEFVDESGAPAHEQSYAILPEEYDPSYFDRQAQAMQDDLDHTAASAQDAARSAQADRILAQFHLKLGESITINDQQQVNKQ